MNRTLHFLLPLVIGTSCAASHGSGASRPGGGERGLASFYADALHGRPTASGEPYDKNAATCAHRTHRFGTRLSVTLRDSGKKVVCRVNDRGPFVKGRVVDVSRRLARELGIVERGLAEVVVTRVD